MERMRIRVRGIVQGVGYRPFVYRLAVRQGLTGWVKNDGEGVLLEVEGEEKELLTFAGGGPVPAAAKGYSVSYPAESGWGGGTDTGISGSGDL